MFDAATQYGCLPVAPTYGVAAPTQAMGTDDIRTGVKGLFDLNNPLTIFGIILAVTFGLAGAAGSVRLGRTKVSASIDQAGG